MSQTTSRQRKEPLFVKSLGPQKWEYFLSTVAEKISVMNQKIAENRVCVVVYATLTANSLENMQPSYPSFLNKNWNMNLQK